jgi:hypothetical protein
MDVKYDKWVGRYVISAVCDDWLHPRILLAVSATDSVTGFWNLYSVPADNAGTSWKCANGRRGYPDYTQVSTALGLWGGGWKGAGADCDMTCGCATTLLDRGSVSVSQYLVRGRCVLRLACAPPAQLAAATADPLGNRLHCCTP